MGYYLKQAKQVDAKTTLTPKASKQAPYRGLLCLGHEGKSRWPIK
jgi:hypothetical protein